MRSLVVVLLGVALSLGAVPAGARAKHVRPRPTVGIVKVAQHSVVLHGKAPRGRWAAVQERRHHRWVGVKWVRVRHHKFRTRVHQRKHTVRYRVIARGRPSRSVRVTLPAPRADSGSGSTATATTPRETGAATSGPQCGGEHPLKADGSAWTCTFDDEFDGSSLDRTKWVPQTNFVTGTPAAHACYQDDPRYVSVGGGTLNLSVRRVDQPVNCVDKSMGATSRYAAGGVMTYHLFSQEYGRFEARYKAQAGTHPGVQETFWLWPDDRYSGGELWPAAGEIDVAETYANYPGLALPYLHTKYDVYGSRPYELTGPYLANTAWTCHADRGVFNTYTLDWAPDSLTIRVNGKLCMKRTGDVSAFQKPYLIALTQLLGSTTGNLPTSATQLPATMQVDYVRVWK